MTYHLVPAADITRVHAESAGEQYRSVITELADGGALVVFEQRVRPDPDLFIYDVEVSAQRYDATGAAQGGLISLARLEGVVQSQVPDYYPFATGLEGGGYVIGWHDRASGDLRVQTHDAAGGLISDILLPVPPRYLDSRDQYVDVSATSGSAAITGLAGAACRLVGWRLCRDPGAVFRGRHDLYPELRRHRRAGWRPGADHALGRQRVLWL
ncbi:hypothetical protein [Rhodophyticola sp.]|uniref:hypothetical protein n=1 Tax=Rhodophyticola sp. TaxID=2680032 RepID=UPI003D264D82